MMMIRKLLQFAFETSNFGNKFDNSALIRHAGFNGSRFKVQGLKFRGLIIHGKSLDTAFSVWGILLCFVFPLSSSTLKLCSNKSLG